jgi:hypothetical protein
MQGITKKVVISDPVVVGRADFLQGAIGKRQKNPGNF